MRTSTLLLPLMLLDKLYRSLHLGSSETKCMMAEIGNMGLSDVLLKSKPILIGHVDVRRGNANFGLPFEALVATCGM